ncbi:MAG: EAL domain-containing protein [Eubacterium sp.]|nr:EAL domain-containing protein [Eubacterium sp.]
MAEFFSANNSQNNPQYNSLLEKFLRDMNEMNGMNGEDVSRQVGEALSELCRFLRVEKLTGVFYSGHKEEKANKGDSYTCYDTGNPSEERMRNRLAVDAFTIVHIHIFQSPDAAPWTDEEISRIDLIQHTLVVYISRLRLGKEVDHFTYFDADGYHNIRYFFRAMQRFAMLDQLNGMVAIHYNLKHFSLVNQQIGRIAGTVVMRNHFNRLQEIIAEDGVMGRMGGDNYLLLCSAEVLDQVVDYLKGTTVVFDPTTQEKVYIQATAGVFPIPQDFVLRDPGDVMDKILNAGQAARHAGGDEIVFYDEMMEEQRERNSRIQRMFPNAIRKKEFRVFYQPKVDVWGKELVGAEALCRWFHEDEIIPPVAFIPVLEQNTDICKLDFYMLEMVCRDIHRWLMEGKQVVRISVNLSRKHMLDVDLLEHILEIVDRNEVPHQYIEIELTETTTDVEFRDLKRVVSGLQQAGICTAVDDFGVGYSSLNLLREIPWNVLKIDKSLLPTDEDGEDSIRSVMFRYVVSMARALGLECITEGVETAQQVELLKKNNCDLAQGFFFDRPLPLESFEERLDRHTY